MYRIFGRRLMVAAGPRILSRRRATMNYCVSQAAGAPVTESTRL
jgi:hypothetical protein